MNNDDKRSKKKYMIYFLYWWNPLSSLKEDIDLDKTLSATFSDKSSSLTRTEYELLYIETLYTIKHKIGTISSKYVQGESDLYAYAQEAFGLSNEDHHRLLAKANEEKVCIIIRYSFHWWISFP